MYLASVNNNFAMVHASLCSKSRRRYFSEFDYLLHDGSIVDYTCNLVFNARCISSTGAERRLNYFRTVQVGNNETKCFEMFWATSFRFRLIISARFR